MALNLGRQPSPERLLARMQTPASLNGGLIMQHPSCMPDGAKQVL